MLHDVLRRLAAEVAATARRENLYGSVVTLKIRFVGFETHTRQHKLPVPTHDERVILREARALLLHGNLSRKPVRLIGLGISAWQQAESVQIDLFDQFRDSTKDERLLETIDRAADRFGKGILQFGSITKTKKTNPSENTLDYWFMYFSSLPAGALRSPIAAACPQATFPNPAIGSIQLTALEPVSKMNNRLLLAKATLRKIPWSSAPRPKQTNFATRATDRPATPSQDKVRPSIPSGVTSLRFLRR